MTCHQTIIGPYLNQNTSAAGVQPFIYAESYNNGIRTDNEILEACYAAVVDGGTIILEAGKTYTLTRRWYMQVKDVRVDMNGATITRANQLITTLTSDVLINATSLPVTSSSGFVIGDRIAIVSDNTGTGVRSLSALITNIVGNTLTVSAISGAASTGHTVLRETSLIVPEVNLEIFNGSFVGNAAGNTVTEAWQLNWAVAGSPTKKLIAHELTISDSPGESLTAGRGSTVYNIRFSNLKGSVFHCSDNQGATPYNDGFFFDNIVGENCCTSAINGHNESWVTTSNNSWNVHAQNCRIRGTRAAIPNIDSNDNRLSLKFVVVENASEDSSISASTTQISTGNVTLDSCLFINCSDFLFSGNDVRKGYAIENIHISNCRFVDCRFAFVNVRNVTWHNNVLWFTSGYVAATAAATIPAAVQFNNFDRVAITDSLFEGPRVHQPGILAGLHLDLNTTNKRKTSGGADTVHLYPSGVKVSNVTIANFPRGIANYQTYGQTVLNSVTGWTYNDVVVYSAREGNGYASSNPTWSIQVPAGCVARNLFIATQFTTSNGNYIPLQIYGINSTGAHADCRGGYVDNATIISVTSQAGIVCAAGAVGNLSMRNIVTRNIRTSFVSPTYFVQDATNSSLEAMTNIGVTVLPLLTGEDPHQYYGLAENSNQY